MKSPADAPRKPAEQTPADRKPSDRKPVERDPSPTRPSTPDIDRDSPQKLPERTPRKPDSKPGERDQSPTRPSTPDIDRDSPQKLPERTPRKPDSKPGERVPSPETVDAESKRPGTGKPAEERPGVGATDDAVSTQQQPNGRGPTGKRPEEIRPEEIRPEGKRPEGKLPESLPSDGASGDSTSSKPRRPQSETELPQPKSPDVRAPRSGDDSTKLIPVVDRPERFVGDVVAGVPMARTTEPFIINSGAGAGGGGGINVSINNSNVNTTINNTTIVNNNTIYNTTNNYNTYVTNVARANGWWHNSSWSSAGPCDVWQPYVCRDGLSISIGFGSGGFSFGLFYSSSSAPLCSSWYNPWWDGYATYWTTTPTYVGCTTPWRPYWRRSLWLTSWHYWDACDPWWHGRWYAHPAICAPAPRPIWTPCFTYSPVICTTFVPVQTVVVTPVPAPPSLPNPSALWTFLAEGYDRDAEDGFAVLAAADPSERAWFVGQGFARAFRGETAWASDILRQAFLDDPSSVTRTSSDGRFIARLEALERSLEPSTIDPSPNIDALVVTAASAAARGDLNGAYFFATTAQAEGDRSAGTAAFTAWLRAELRARSY